MTSEWNIAGASSTIMLMLCPDSLAWMQTLCQTRAAPKRRLDQGECFSCQSAGTGTGGEPDALSKRWSTKKLRVAHEDLGPVLGWKEKDEAT